MVTGTEMAIRMDTEDFLTPESDAALEMVLDALERHDATATFPLVAEKLRSWDKLGHRQLIGRLARHAVGYHSNTHSVHPTIAEELAPLGWPAAQAAFAAREAAGFAEVEGAFGPLACWTQPGGNWTAAALAVVCTWRIPMEFSEAWNSYLDFSGRPCHYLGLLHWSPPVCAPKPFLSALPGCLDEALALVDSALGRLPADGPPLCVVAHPTELCTSAFWDVVNFGRGRMPQEGDWRPAPLRAATDVGAAAEALGRFVAELRGMGLEFITARDLAARFPDRARNACLTGAQIRPMAACVLEHASWAVCGSLALSAAEALGVVCRALCVPDAAAIAVRACDGPSAPPPADSVAGPLTQSALVEAARWCDRFIDQRGQVPSAIPIGRSVAAPADFLSAAARVLRDPEQTSVVIAPRAVAAEVCVKPPARLHWDWPVFAEGFAPMELWLQARLQAWTLKPALSESAGTAGAASWSGEVRRGSAHPVPGRLHPPAPTTGRPTAPPA